MKTLKNFAVACFVAILACTAAPTAEAQTITTSFASVLERVPSSFIVEQTASLSNGKTVHLYYKKTGNQCEVFSPDDLRGYTPDDLLKITTSTFTVVSKVKGKRVYHCTVAQAAAFTRQLANAIL